VVLVTVSAAGITTPAVTTCTSICSRYQLHVQLLRLPAGTTAAPGAARLPGGHVVVQEWVGRHRAGRDEHDVGPVPAVVLFKPGYDLLKGSNLQLGRRLLRPLREAVVVVLHPLLGLVQLSFGLLSLLANCRICDLPSAPPHYSLCL
jgi:hypothetical protein